MPPSDTDRSTEGTRRTGQASILKMMRREASRGATAAAHSSIMRFRVAAFTQALFRRSRKMLPYCEVWNSAATDAAKTRSLPTITCGNSLCATGSSQTKHTRDTADRRLRKLTACSSCASATLPWATQPRCPPSQSFTLVSSILMRRTDRCSPLAVSKKLFHCNVATVWSRGRKKRDPHEIPGAGKRSPFWDHP